MHESIHKLRLNLKAKGQVMRSLMLCGIAAFTMAGAASAQDETPAAIAPQSSAPTAAEQANGPLQAALAAYAAYQQDVTTLRDGAVNSAESLTAMIDLGASHHYPDLGRGVIAYGAFAGAQSPVYVRALRDAEAYFGRQGIILQLTRDPAYARTLRGADEAGQLAMSALNYDVARIDRVARRYSDLYRDGGSARWGRAALRGNEARVTRLAGLGPAGLVRPVTPALTARLFAAPATLSPAADAGVLGGAFFWDTAISQGAVTYQAATPTRQTWQADPMRAGGVDRMLTLAALHALGAERDRPDAYPALLTDPFLTNCLAAAQSGYLACQGSTGRQHEGAFCIAKHALGWGQGDITVNSVALCMSRLTQPAPPTPAMTMTPTTASATSAGDTGWTTSAITPVSPQQ